MSPLSVPIVWSLLCVAAVDAQQVILPLFATCRPTQPCEANAACRFNICLPNVRPTPVIITNPTKPLIIQPDRIVSGNANATTATIMPPLVPTSPQLPPPSPPPPPPPPATPPSTPPPPPTRPPVPRTAVRVVPRLQVLPVPVHACAGTCHGQARCVKGACMCPAIYQQYSPGIGCITFIRRFPMPAYIVPPRMFIPQAKPGQICQPNVECSGGSLCSLGVCVCPPELVQSGESCVTPSTLGWTNVGLPGYFNIF